MPRAWLVRHVPSAFLLLLVAACAGDPDSPLPADPVASTPSFAKAAAPESDDFETVSPVLAEMNERLAAEGSDLRVLKAEFIVRAEDWEGASQTLIADDRDRGLGYEWVARDPRRDGRTGVTYAIDPRQGQGPFIRNPAGGALVLPFSGVEARIEEGMDTWRGQSCGRSPITRVAVPAGIDPDQLDNLFLGSDGGRGTPVRVADIVHGGWQPVSFFTAFAGPAGGGILGVAFTFTYVGPDGARTDIDNDGNQDTSLVEVYYNAGYYWGTSGASDVVDFYSIITHETGHAMGLAHFGKIFVTKKDAADGLSIDEVKYAPQSMMNAAYITGRSAITGTDKSSFCQIWGARR